MRLSHPRRNHGGAMKWIAGIFSLAFLFSLLLQCLRCSGRKRQPTERNGIDCSKKSSDSAQIGEKIYRMDALKTGRDGSLGVVFKDDTLLSIGPQSEIIISEFLFSPAEGSCPSLHGSSREAQSI